MINLPKRIQKLQRMTVDAQQDLYTQQHSVYTEIWDCCCDHGLLGMSLLNEGLNIPVYFADIVPHIIDELTSKLHQSFGDKQHVWQTHCIDVANIQAKSAYPLFIIAGVGSDLTAQMVTDLLKNHKSTSPIDFLICSTNRNYSLRKKLLDVSLAEFNLKVIQEQLIKDKKRFYEAILIRRSPVFIDKPISTVGNQLWDITNKAELQTATEYLNLQLAHYHRAKKGYLQKNKPEQLLEVQVIIDEYVGIQQMLIKT